MINLNELKINQSAIIEKIEKNNLKNRLTDLGFVKKTIVKPVLISPFKDPIAYKVKGSVIALRNEDAKYIKVRVIDE